jgi:pyruvate-formate lyase
MCVICDARRLRDVVFVPTEKSFQPDNVDSPDFGQTRDYDFDQETGEFYELDENNERIVIEETMLFDERAKDAKRSRQLEAQADKILAEAELIQNQEAIDPLLAFANKVRAKHGLHWINLKSFRLKMSDRQAQALMRLGWLESDLRVMKLSVADASRLLQRGPLWLKKA